MKNVEKHINDIISKVLSEQVAVRTEEIMSMANEELHGNQKKLDKNKNNKIDADDFKKLRGEMGEDDVDTQWMDDEKLAKNEPLYRGTKFVDKSEMQEYSFGDTATDDDLSYNDMLPSDKYEKEIKTPHKVKNVDDKYQRKVSKEFSEGEIEENIFKKMFGKKDDSEEKDKEEHKKGNSSLWDAGYDYDDIRGWHMPAPGQHRFDRDPKDSKDVEMEEGKKFPDLSGDGKVTRKDVLLGRGVKLKESIQLTEDELVELIEKIVKEQTEVKETNASLKKSKTENDDYIQSVTKKMKEYLKDGSKGKYDMNPEQFPKGNGELAKMAKKAYTPSKAVEEYIDNFVYSPGMETLEYEIKPNDEWLEKNIEGSSMTGNGKGGNAIDTGLGKKINAKRKKNLYAVEKNRSYNRVAQPVVDNAGEDTHSNTLDSIFKKLGESDEKQTKLINEDVEKMRHLLGYKKKTQ
jgi:hypothetical protein